MEQNDYKLIGNRIKQAREEAGLSQKALAEKVDYESATAISLIEGGQREVAVDVLEKISRCLNKDINYFLGKDTVAPNLEFALRADKNLSSKDKEDIKSFIDFVKNRGNK